MHKRTDLTIHDGDVTILHTEIMGKQVVVQILIILCSLPSIRGQGNRPYK